MSTKLEMLEKILQCGYTFADKNYALGECDRISFLEEAFKSEEDFNSAVEELRKALSEHPHFSRNKPSGEALEGNRW